VSADRLALQFVTGWRRDAIVASGAGRSITSGATSADRGAGRRTGRGGARLPAGAGIPLAGPLAAIVFLGGLVPYLGG